MSPIKIGMLIKGLNLEDEYGVITQLDPLRVSYPGLPNRPQRMVATARVRWPWEEQWVPVGPGIHVIIEGD